MSFETRLYIDAVVLMLYISFLITSVIDRHDRKFVKSMNGIFISCVVHMIAGIATDCYGYFRIAYTMQFVYIAVYYVSGYVSLYHYGLFYCNTCDANEKTIGLIKKLNLIILILNTVSTVPFFPTKLILSITPDLRYQAGPLYFLSYIFVFTELITLSVLSLFIQKNRRKAFGYVAFGVFPIAISVVMIIYPIPSNIYDAATMVSCAMLYSYVYLTERRRMLENETKLIKYKSDIMLSQIGPHFIYNTLATISALCVVNPEKAQELTADFSDYLRTNLNFSHSERISPFSDELRHTKKYLEIEKVRFEDILNIEYDIEETDFFLPSLSLQPIVENAVKHGVTEKRGGGTVKISSCRRDDYFVVTVSDDGAGFDVSELKPREGHYGIFTVKERIEILLDGHMTLESTPGIGTTVTIFVKSSSKALEKAH